MEGEKNMKPSYTITYDKWYISRFIELYFFWVKDHGHLKYYVNDHLQSSGQAGKFFRRHWEYF